MRRDFVAAPDDPAIIADLDRRTSALQAKIWDNVSAIVRERPDAVAASLMGAINETFDATTAQRFAYATRLPRALFWLLLGMAVFGMGALGYQLGVRRNPFYMLIVILAGTWTVVIVDILDLDAARVGALRTTTVAYEWTLQGFYGGATVPGPSGGPAN